MANPVQDPVCGMMIDPDKTSFKSKHQGDTYHFCSADCKKAFDAEPQTYAELLNPGQRR